MLARCIEAQSGMPDNSLAFRFRKGWGRRACRNGEKSEYDEDGLRYQSKTVYHWLASTVVKDDQQPSLGTGVFGSGLYVRASTPWLQMLLLLGTSSTVTRK